ncbi:hypothetical protein BMI90_16435 [Thioclava sp. L04-15]|nr:hypothetical protein BMI90_16435 [Thioclava sp. L04-15]
MLKRLDLRMREFAEDMNDEDAGRFFDREFDMAMAVTARAVWLHLINAAHSKKLAVIGDKTGFLLASSSLVTIFDDDEHGIPGLERDDGPFIDIRKGVFGILDMDSDTMSRTPILPAGLGVVLVAADVSSKAVQGIQDGMKKEFPTSSMDEDNLAERRAGGRPPDASAAVASVLESLAPADIINSSTKSVARLVRDETGRSVSDRTIQRMRAKYRN